MLSGASNQKAVAPSDRVSGTSCLRKNCRRCLTPAFWVYLWDKLPLFKLVKLGVLVVYRVVACKNLVDHQICDL